jgi:hypothetical protein
MKWIKKGLIIRPPVNLDWAATHAAVPIAEKLEGDMYRIYCSVRDRQNRSQVAYFDIDIRHFQDIIGMSEKPMLTYGELGAFDESGAMASWIVNHKGKRYLYYIGWTLGATVPFFNSIGLAISQDEGKTFTKWSKGPIMSRDEKEPYFVASLCVRIEGGVWRMWYLSCVKWVMEAGKPKHYYNIKYAESKDGIKWTKTGIVCIDFRSKDEYAISRPCVIFENGAYKMWYSYRGKSYRIGYAESPDGIHWERKDEDVGIDVSKSGWDSEMIEYPFVFDHDGKRYMLYNGNGYGKTGIGLAVLKE